MFDGFATLASTLGIVANSLVAEGIQPVHYRGDPTFATNAYLESLRLNSPVALISRQAIDDFEYQGTHVPRDTELMMMWLVANNDPSVFADPSSFRLERDNRTQQYSFGGGPYICAGRNVARIVCETMLAEMAHAGITLT